MEWPSKRVFFCPGKNCALCLGITRERLASSAFTTLPIRIEMLTKYAHVLGGCLPSENSFCYNSRVCEEPQKGFTVYQRLEKTGKLYSGKS